MLKKSSFSQFFFIFLLLWKWETKKHINSSWVRRWLMALSHSIYSISCLRRWWFVLAHNIKGCDNGVIWQIMVISVVMNKWVESPKVVKFAGWFLFCFVWVLPRGKRNSLAFFIFSPPWMQISMTIHSSKLMAKYPWFFTAGNSPGKVTECEKVYHRY